MHPDKIRVQQPGKRHQAVGVVFIQADLRHLTQKNIGGVQIDGTGCTTQVVHKFACNEFGCGAAGCAGENAVHVQVKHRHTARNGIQSQRIEGRININNAGQVFGCGLDAALECIADVLPFQLVPVRAGHDTQPGQSGQIGSGRFLRMVSRSCTGRATDTTVCSKRNHFPTHELLQNSIGNLYAKAQNGAICRISIILACISVLYL